MKPFIKAEVPKEEIDRIVMDYLKAYREGDKLMVETFGEKNPQIKAAIRKTVEDQYKTCEVFRNDIYQVARKDLGNGVVHLSIRRIDRVTCHDWRDFQEIKNQLVGPGCEAVELYPAEDRIVDTANQYHLWAMKDPTFRFPLGFTPGGATTSESEIDGSKQGKIDPDEGRGGAVGGMWNTD